ncbi:MAG: hypothetical protein AAGI08_00935 [Bacteroidota bacterium]
MESSDAGIPQRLVTIARYRTPFEAEIVRGRLESEGLTVQIADAELVIADWLLSNAIGGVRLQVPAIEVEYAQHVLSTVEPLEDAETPESEAEVNARAALHAAALGLAFLPLQLYAAWLLLKVSWSDDPLPAATRRHVFWTFIFLAIGAVVVAVFFLTLP